MTKCLPLSAPRCKHAFTVCRAEGSALPHTARRFPSNERMIALTMCTGESEEGYHVSFVGAICIPVWTMTDEYAVIFSAVALRRSPSRYVIRGGPTDTRRYLSRNLPSLAEWRGLPTLLAPSRHKHEHPPLSHHCPFVSQRCSLKQSTF